MAEDECREHYIELLENYKCYRCLWDPSHPLYSNRENRSHAYNDLLKVYKKIKVDANIGDLKRKLDNMRTTYNRELKKVLIYSTLLFTILTQMVILIIVNLKLDYFMLLQVKDSITNGKVTSRQYIPKLWYYEYLAFLSEKDVIVHEGRDAEENSQDNENVCRFFDSV